MANRTVLRSAFRAAVATTALAGALTACTPVKIGTAATIGGERITTAELDDTVSDWKREFQADPQAGLIQQASQQRAQEIEQQTGQSAPSIPFDLDSPRRSALYQLIEYRIWDRVAREEGITVTAGQIDTFIASNGGRRSIVSQVLARDVPERNTADVLRAELIQREFYRRAGVNVDSPTPQPGAAEQARIQQARQRVDTLYAQAAKELKIKVNPRFGAYDPAQGTLAPVSSGLSKVESGTG